MKNAGNDLPLPAHIYSDLVDSKTSDTGLFFNSKPRTNLRQQQTTNAI